MIKAPGFSPTFIPPSAETGLRANMLARYALPVGGSVSRGRGSEFGVVTAVAELLAGGSEGTVFFFGADGLAPPAAAPSADLEVIATCAIVTQEGFELGALTVAHSLPVTLTARQLRGLHVLAAQVATQLELRRKVAELDVERSALASLNAELERFTAVAAHDLRSPLRAMGSFAGLLRRRMRDRMSPEEDEMFDHIRAGAARLSAMVEGILGFAKARHQDFTHLANVDLPTLVGEVGDLVDPDQHYTITFVGETRRVRANASAIQHILLNLVSNAVKYHHRPEGRITVGCTRTAGNAIVITVTDDGPGIAAEDKERIFEAFETGEHDLHVPSTGLGLALVRRLVERLGGEVRLRSELGEGSCFEVQLPA